MYIYLLFIYYKLNHRQTAGAKESYAVVYSICRS